jgi:hypothetical protein
MRTLSVTTRLGRAALLGATMLSGLVAVEAHAQTAPAAETANNDAVEEIVVTGYRRSLEQSTVAKRDSTSFSDTIFAEDIGKFPTPTSLSRSTAFPASPSPGTSPARAPMSPSAAWARTSPTSR